MSEEMKKVEQGSITPEERTLGLVCVLLQFLTVVGPLIVWLIKKDESAYLNALGKETINFQLTPLVGLFGLVMIIVAAVKANEGIIYRYPFCFRFLK